MSRIFFVLLGLLPTLVFGADIGYAENKSGDILGLKIEGEIVKGDADKLLELLRLSGPRFGRIFLNSKGGDVEEAMKIGRIFRRLRLPAEVPTYYPGLKPICGPKLSDESNCVCASACFLIFGGAVYRGGNLLALHRPFFTRKAASQMSDVQHEGGQKGAMAMTTIYLEEMEVPSYFTNIMMSRNSQEAYIVTADEASDNNHSINGYVPSIEEITLSKCKVGTSRDYAAIQKLARKGDAASSQEKALRKSMSDQYVAGIECQVEVVNAMRAEAFNKEFSGDLNWKKK
jgi:hypothetical protein